MENNKTKVSAMYKIPADIMHTFITAPYRAIDLLINKQTEKKFLIAWRENVDAEMRKYKAYGQSDFAGMYKETYAKTAANLKYTKGKINARLKELGEPVKENSIPSRFKVLQENYTPDNVNDYIDFLKSQPMKEILENSQSIFVEPTMGANFILESFKDHDFTMEQLSNQHKKLKDYMDKCIEGGYSNTEHLESLRHCRNVLHEQFTLKNTVEYLKENTISILEEQMDYIDEIITESAKSSVEEGIGEMAPTVGYEEGAGQKPLKKKKAELDFAVNFVQTFMDEDDEINLESFKRMMQAANRYELLTEGLNDTVGKAARNMHGSTHRTVSNIRKNMSDSHRASVAVQKIPAAFDSLINNTFGAIARMDQGERRKRIIEGGFKVKLLKIIRDGILLGGAFAVHPALAAIGLIVKLCMDAKLDRNARSELVEELEMELKMTQEKLKDAEHKGDIKKKYQLMRIENALSRDLKRIRWYQNGTRVSPNGVVK